MSVLMKEQAFLANRDERDLSPLMIIISGPSGVGKDALIVRMKERHLPFHFVVTATTRPRRPAEVEGVDYIFVNVSEFADMIARNDLLEYAVVYGDYKGIPKQQVRDALNSGKDVIMRIDVQGAATMRRLVPEAIFIFLTAESDDALEKRLRERKTEPDDQLKLRIATARQEMHRLDDFEYLIVNHENELDRTVDQVSAIIQAERCRVKQRKIAL